MAPDDLTEAEAKVAKTFLEDVNRERREKNQKLISLKDAVKFVTARKFDLERAKELFKSHEDVRLRERLQNIDPCKDDLRKELISGKLTILDPYDDHSAAIAVYTARFHNPLTSSRQTTLQSLVLQLDAALERVSTQRNGLVFVYDMTDSKFSNFDYDLSVKILGLLKGSFPARLKKVLVVLAPMWFKAPFKILRLFVREKLRDRVYTVDTEELSNHIPVRALPQHLGGIQAVNHTDWLRKCLQGSHIPDAAISAFFRKVEEPNFFTSKFPKQPILGRPCEQLDNHQNHMAENRHNGRDFKNSHQPSATPGRRQHPVQHGDGPPPVPARMSSTALIGPVKPLRRLTPLSNPTALQPTSAKNSNSSLGSTKYDCTAPTGNELLNLSTIALLGNSKLASSSCPGVVKHDPLVPIPSFQLGAKGQSHEDVADTTPEVTVPKSRRNSLLRGTESDSSLARFVGDDFEESRQSFQGTKGKAAAILAKFNRANLKQVGIKIKDRISSSSVLIKEKLKESKDKLSKTASATSAIIKEKAANIADSLKEEYQEYEERKKMKPISEKLISEDTSKAKENRRRSSIKPQMIKAPRRKASSDSSNGSTESSETSAGALKIEPKLNAERTRLSVPFPPTSAASLENQPIKKSPSGSRKTSSADAALPGSTFTSISPAALENYPILPGVVFPSISESLTPVAGDSNPNPQTSVLQPVVPANLTMSPSSTDPSPIGSNVLLDQSFSELMKQSELLQVQLAHLSSKPLYEAPKELPDNNLSSRKIKTRKKKASTKCGHIFACNCSSSAQSDQSDEEVIPDVPHLGPSWEDTDHYESVFSGSLPNLMTPKQQLAKVLKLHKNGLVNEYMALRSAPHVDTFNIARLAINNNKNRYSDVLCYDYTRVVLGDRKTDDYINANHMNSFEQKRGYICCQGPLPKTRSDFWRMIWQEKVRTIVMTTKLVEKGRTKCHTYWPQTVNEMEQYGSFNVMTMDVSEQGDFQKTTLCLCNKETGETRFLKHLLFLKWPDYGIPSSAEAFLKFVLSAREAQSASVKDMPEWKGHPRGPPMVVHCSAGVGRTGTFICADICMYMLEKLTKLNIQEVVKNIRSQRAYAVQMPDHELTTSFSMSSKSVVKGLRGSTTGNVGAPDIVKLSFGELINLSLGHTEDVTNYGSVSFGLLRELLLALCDHIGVRNKLALQYDAEEPPACISTAVSPLNSKELLKLNLGSVVDKLANVDDEPANMPVGINILEPSENSVNSSSDGEVAKSSEKKKGSDSVPSISVPVKSEAPEVLVEPMPATELIESAADSIIIVPTIERTSASDDNDPKEEQENQPADDPLSNFGDRLENLESAVKAISKLGIEVQEDQIGDPVHPSKMVAKRQHVSDVECRLANVEKGFDLMTGIIGKVKDRIIKMDKNLNALKEEGVAWARERQSLERKKSARDEPAGTPTHGTVVSSEQPAERTTSATCGMGGVCNEEKHASQTTAPESHKLGTPSVSQPASAQSSRQGSEHQESSLVKHVNYEGMSTRLQRIDDSFNHLEDVVENEHKALETMAEDIVAMKLLYEKLDQGQTGQDDEHLRLKKFVMDALASIESRVAQLASWNSLEKYMKSGGEQLPPYGTALARLQQSGSKSEMNKTWQQTTSRENVSGYSNLPPQTQQIDDRQRIHQYSQATQPNPPGWGYVPAYGQNYYLPPSAAQTPAPPIPPEPHNRRMPPAPPSAGPIIPLPEWQDTLDRFTGETESDVSARAHPTPGPSDGLKRTLESLGSLSQHQETMSEMLEKVTHNKADRREVLDQHEFLLNYIRQLEAIVKDQAEMLVDFRETLQHVDAQKIDRDYFNFALSMKCDKKEVEGFIDKKYFDANTRGNEEAIADLKIRVRHLERISDWRTTTDALLSKVNYKVDKEEILALNKILHNFDAKLNDLAHRANLKVNSDEAVAFRKQLVSFNCLSCSKGLMLNGQTKPSSLPMEGPMSGLKSIKAYTSQEMSKIRDKLQDRDQMVEIYSSPRPVGGAYTMIDPLRNIRNTRNANIQEEIATGTVSAAAAGFNYPSVNVYNQVIVGKDGRMYKAGDETDVDKKLPNIRKIPKTNEGEDEAQQRPNTATSIKSEPL